ncbi:hypothetical protein SprV_0501776100 [Sparganum proliferum]
MTILPNKNAVVTLAEGPVRFQSENATIIPSDDEVQKNGLLSISESSVHFNMLEALGINSGVKKVCILASILFGLVLSVVLVDAYRDARHGIRIDYSTEGHVLNSQCMQVSMRLSTTTVNDLLFADDFAMNTTAQGDLKRSMDILDAGCTKFRLTISIDKKVLMHQPSANTEYGTSQANVNDNRLKTGCKSSCGIDATFA